MDSLLCHRDLIKMNHLQSDNVGCCGGYILDAGIVNSTAGVSELVILAPVSDTLMSITSHRTNLNKNPPRRYLLVYLYPSDKLDLTISRDTQDVIGSLGIHLSGADLPPCPSYPTSSPSNTLLYSESSLRSRVSP